MHNVYLLIWVEGGLPALVAWLGVLAVGFAAAVRGLSAADRATRRGRSARTLGHAPVQRDLLQQRARLRSLPRRAPVPEPGTGARDVRRGTDAARAIDAGFNRRDRQQPAAAHAADARRFQGVAYDQVAPRFRHHRRHQVGHHLAPAEPARPPAGLHAEPRDPLFQPPFRARAGVVPVPFRDGARGSGGRREVGKLSAPPRDAAAPSGAAARSAAGGSAAQSDRARLLGLLHALPARPRSGGIWPAICSPAARLCPASSRTGSISATSRRFSSSFHAGSSRSSCTTTSAATPDRCSVRSARTWASSVAPTPNS